MCERVTEAVNDSDIVIDRLCEIDVVCEVDRVTVVEGVLDCDVVVVCEVEEDAVLASETVFVGRSLCETDIGTEIVFVMGREFVGDDESDAVRVRDTDAEFDAATVHVSVVDTEGDDDSEAEMLSESVVDALCDCDLVGVNVCVGVTAMVGVTVKVGVGVDDSLVLRERDRDCENVNDRDNVNVPVCVSSIVADLDSVCDCD